MSGVCWAHPPHHFHIVGCVLGGSSPLHGLQFKAEAEGQETLSVRYTYLRLGVCVAPVGVTGDAAGLRCY